MSTDAPDFIPLFPLSQGIFPDGMLQLKIFEVRYLDLIRRCHREQTPFGVVWLAQGQEVQVPGQVPQLYPWGCEVLVREIEALQPALLRVRCQAITRFMLESHVAGPLGVWQGKVTRRPDDPVIPLPDDLQYLAGELGRLIADTQRRGLGALLPIYAPYRLDECGWVANRLAELIQVDASVKQALMGEDDPEARLRRVGTLMAR